MKKNQESLCNQDMKSVQLEGEQKTNAVQEKLNTAISKKEISREYCEVFEGNYCAIEEG